ncbi:MAG: Zn-ribbon domain-containing OB-fold protein [Syntrophales bacterium]|jgi:hypothetical protein|nr:Zn-ribbon domain-containing OB-fold protein [Syntrophales bacterium]MCK9392351.1 Zn-ribbon domain-containing OB-fold protein [Syntrophales bacterium]
MATLAVDNRFNEFGTMSFTSVTRVNDFIGYLQQGRIMGSRCKKCGISFFPPRADCCHSLDSDMEWFEVKGTGKLLSFSTLRFGPTGFTQGLPYTIAVLDYGDYKIFGRIESSISEAELHIGMEMKTCPHRLTGGHVDYVFQKT